MARIICQRRIIDDDWQRLPPDAASIPAQGKLIVPLALWRVQRANSLWRRRPLGLWLEADDDPGALVEDFSCFETLAIRVPQFSDGRVFSSARLLRERYAWRGALRAFGDVRRDQLRDLERVGFDTFELPGGEDLQAALGAFEEISEAYQGSATQPEPLFRRRRAVA